MKPTEDLSLGDGYDLAIVRLLQLASGIIYCIACLIECLTFNYYESALDEKVNKFNINLT